jgi:hypothetical protein
MCEAPLFLIETMAISGIEPMVVFRIATTLYESGGTPDVVVRSKDIFVPPIVPHIVYEANCTTKVSKVQPESWHVGMAKLHDFLMQPTIDQTSVIFCVVVVHNE